MGASTYRPTVRPISIVKFLGFRAPRQRQKWVRQTLVVGRWVRCAACPTLGAYGWVTGLRGAAHPLAVAPAKFSPQTVSARAPALGPRQQSSPADGWRPRQQSLAPVPRARAALATSARAYGRSPEWQPSLAAALASSNATNLAQQPLTADAPSRRIQQRLPETSHKQHLTTPHRGCRPAASNSRQSHWSSPGRLLCQSLPPCDRMCHVLKLQRARQTCER